MLIALCLIATCLSLGYLVARRQWLRITSAVVIWAMIAYILILYTGSVARLVLKPGPPIDAGAGGFFLGIQLFQDALFDSYLVVIYLSTLNLLNCLFASKTKV